MVKKQENRYHTFLPLIIMYFWSSYIPWQHNMDKVKVILENSCRAEARAGLRRTLAAIATVLIFWFSGADLSARNRSCRSVMMVEEEGRASERSPRKQQS